jgi:hypothetical protein
MSSRLGHNFANVRVHSDPRSDESTRAVGAAAYAVGDHLVLRNRPYDVTAPRDRYLIAHELAHVAQQRTPFGRTEALSIGANDDPLERQADAAANAVAGGGAAPVQGYSRAGVLRRAPTGIELAEEKPFGHADLKTDALKQKRRTYLGATTLMKATPTGNYTGHCTKEYLTEVANTCPAKRFGELVKGGFCTGDKCLEFNSQGYAGDPSTGKSVTDGPSTFIDRHRTSGPVSLLEGTGVKACSIVCHQLYKFDRKDTLGAFYVIRNFRAGSYTPLGAKKPLHITTGEVRKVPAPTKTPSREEFAKKTAPGLKTKGVLADPPAVPKEGKKK